MVLSCPVPTMSGSKWNFIIKNPNFVIMQNVKTPALQALRGLYIIDLHRVRFSVIVKNLLFEK